MPQPGDCRDDITTSFPLGKAKRVKFPDATGTVRMVQRKISQADSLLGFPQETCVLVPAKQDYCNWGKESPKKAVQETEQTPPEGVSFET